MVPHPGPDRLGSPRLVMDVGSAHGCLHGSKQGGDRDASLGCFHEHHKTITSLAFYSDGFEVIYGSMGRFDTWNVFVYVFEDFKKSMVKFEIVIV